MWYKKLIYEMSKVRGYENGKMVKMGNPAYRKRFPTIKRNLPIIPTSV